MGSRRADFCRLYIVCSLPPDGDGRGLVAQKPRSWQRLSFHELLYLFCDSLILPTGFTLWAGWCSCQFFSLLSPDPVASYLLDCRQSGSGFSERSMDVVF